MHKMPHAPISGPSAWRGLQNPASSGATLSQSIAKEFQEHPVQTLGFIAAAVAMARLAFARSKKERRDPARVELAARRRTGH